MADAECKIAGLFVIFLLAGVVALCQLPHVIASSVEAAYLVFQGQASVVEYLWSFFLPTSIGNRIGGVLLVALLGHAPLVSEFKGDVSP